jgi:PadR family transcriptional regulator PadR
MVPTSSKVLTQMRKGVLEFCVLAYLKDRTSYGLEIASGLGAHDALFSSEGTLYPLLARLRKQGYVETLWHDSTSGPPRRYYTLTSDGEAALEEFITAWRPFVHGVTLILEGTK